MAKLNIPLGGGGGTSITSWSQVPKPAGGITATDLDTSSLSTLFGKVFTPEAYGAKGDGTTDDGAAINACLAAASAVSGVVSFRAGATYRTTIGLTAGGTGLVQIEGNNATIQATANTFDLLSLGPVGLSDVARTGGYVRRLNVRGPGGDDSNAAPPETRKAGIVWNSTRHARVEDCFVTNVDVAYDLRGNCYGSKFIRCRAGVTANVGILLRGGSGLVAGSGSDIQVDGFWGGGAKAAFWMEGNAGGYWFNNCKVGAGYSAFAASPKDQYGVFLIGPTYEAQTTVAANVAAGASTITVADGSKVFGGRVLIGTQEITVSSKSGNVLTVPTSGTGSVTTAISSGAGVQVVGGGIGSMSVVGGGIEGATGVHAIRMFEDSSELAFTDFSFNSNGSSGQNQMIQVLKHSRGGSPSITFRRCSVQGSWTGPTPLTVNMTNSYSPQIIEEGTTHANYPGPSFNGTMMFFQERPMVSYSAIPGSSAIMRRGVYLDGVGLRGNSGSIQQTTDFTTWSALGGGGAASTAEFPSGIEEHAAGYAIASGDAGKLLVYNVNTTAGTYALPDVAAVPAGFTVTVTQGWSGQLTVAASTGDGIRTPLGTIPMSVKTKGSGSILRFVRDVNTRWYCMPFGDSLATT